MIFFKCSSPLIFSFRYVRDYSRRLKLRDLYAKRLEIGPDKPRHRSEFSNWNYDAEIYAFGKRLGEDFDSRLLHEAFVDKSYLAHINNPGIPDNTDLFKEGYAITKGFTRSFLIKIYEHLPKEWIDQISDHLLSKETTAHISGHLGTRDLILCDKVEVDLEAESKALFAVIGALAKSQNNVVALTFIKDFILTQLTTFHLCDIINIERPVNLLTGLMRYHKKPDPVTRLLRQSGVNSIFSCYHVGIYTGECLLGDAAGDQISVAEDEAFKQSLRNLFGIPENKPAINFSRDYEVDDSKEAVSVEEYLKYV